MKAHPTDSVSLFFGVVFLAVASGWLTYAYAEPQLPHIGWFVAGAAVLLGVAGLAGALIPSRNRDLEAGGEPMPEAMPDADPPADNLNQ